MADDSPTGRRDLEPVGAASLGARDVQSAELELVAGPLQLRLRARLTPLGILALGVALSGIVASSSAVVWAGRRRSRDRRRLE